MPGCCYQALPRSAVSVPGDMGVGLPVVVVGIAEGESQRYRSPSEMGAEEADGRHNSMSRDYPRHPPAGHHQGWVRNLDYRSLVQGF